MNIVQIILKQEEVYGFILKMKQLILMIILKTLVILNLSSVRLIYQETQKFSYHYQNNGNRNSKIYSNCCAIKIFQ